MARMVVAGLVVIGLITGIWLLWPEEDGSSPQPTQGAAVTTITTESETTPTTTAPATTPDGHLVTTVEEAEAILRDLWFGWFEGIYDQDEARIREVVATEELVEDARRAFVNMEFVKVPTASDIEMSEIEILKATPDCLVIWSVSNADFLGPGPERSGADVLRFFRGGWRWMSSWQLKNDLWEADCEARLSF